MPSGAILQFAGSAAPSGYLLCDGSAVSRTTYAALFSAIGTTYGTGDGSTTFNVPDFRGRVPSGFAASGGHADVSALGNSDGVALAHRRPKHTHTINNPPVAFVSGASLTWTQDSGGANVNNASMSIGNDPTHDPVDAAAYLVVNFIIKT